MTPAYTLYHGYVADDNWDNIADAWERVLDARTIPSVIARSNEWIEELWPYARQLGYSPKGTGPNWINIPTIAESNWGPYPSHHLAGWYTQGTSNNIKIVGRDHLKLQAKKMRWPVNDYLRETILHETQHALDWSRGVDSSDHDCRFSNRLRKLRRSFPDYR